MVTAASTTEAIDVRFASSSVQGRRPYNEDRCCVHHPLFDENLTQRSTSMFSVFDGHGGEDCAEWVKRHLPTHLCRHLAQRASAAASASSPPSSTSSTSSTPSSSSSLTSSAISTAITADTPIEHILTKSFASCDEQLLLEEASGAANSGTTASCVLITHDHIYTGNCGDTRVVLCRGGRAIELGRDHKPQEPCERQRVEAAGGQVTIQEPPPMKQTNRKATMRPFPIQAYVELGDKGLAVSRAFGNISFKQNPARAAHEQCIIVHPFTSSMARAADDEFLIIASDGLWNFVQYELAVSFVRDRLKSESEEERNVEDICHKLTQHALDKKSNDNVTVVLIVFPSAYDPQRLAAVDAAKALADDAGIPTPRVTGISSLSDPNVFGGGGGGGDSSSSSAVCTPHLAASHAPTLTAVAAAPLSEDAQ